MKNCGYFQSSSLSPSSSTSANSNHRSNTNSNLYETSKWLRSASFQYAVNCGVRFRPQIRILIWIPLQCLVWLNLTIGVKRISNFWYLLILMVLSYICKVLGWFGCSSSIVFVIIFLSGCAVAKCLPIWLVCAQEFQIYKSLVAGLMTFHGA